MAPGKTQATARNQRYKLYGSGEFYDVPNDLQEKQPLATDKLTPKQVAIKGELQDVLNHYEQFDRLAQVVNGHQ
jgi:arylsulfatase A